jgi:hypothetical protein
MGEWLKLESTYTPEDVKITFDDNPRVEIIDNKSLKRFNIQFIDENSDNLIYETIIASNQWCSSTDKSIKHWKVKITGIDNDFYYERRSPK